MRPLARSEKAHTLQQRTISHTSRSKDDLLPRREIIRVVNLVRILYAHRRQPVEYLLARRHLVFVYTQTIRIEHEPRLDLTVQTLHRRGSDNAFGRAADSHQRMDICSSNCRRNTRREVAIRDQTNASAGRSHVVNEFFVS